VVQDHFKPEPYSKIYQRIFTPGLREIFA